MTGFFVLLCFFVAYCVGILLSPENTPPDASKPHPFGSSQ